MKVENFEPTGVDRRKIREIGTEVTVYATVDVTTGFIFKKTRKVEVYRLDSHWRYLETGDFTDGRLVENLASSYEARNHMKLEDWEAPNA